MSFSTPEVAVIFLALAAMLVVFGIIGVIWLQLGFAGMAFAVRGLIRLGLYDPSERTPKRTVKREDRGVLLFTGALRRVSRLIPADPHRSVLPYMIPLLLVGIPAGLVIMGVFFLLPVFLMMRTASAAPSGWAHLFVIGTFFGYYGLIPVLFSLWKRSSFLGGGYLYANPQ